MTKTALALAALLAAGSSCSTDGGGADCDGDNCDTSGFVPTSNTAVALNTGYDALFEKKTSQCVDLAAPSGGTDFVVGSFSGPPLEVVFTDTREELASEMGLDLGLKVKYLTTDAAAKVNMVRKTKTNSMTVNALIKSRTSYSVQAVGEHTLNANGTKALAGGVNKFVAACGSNYVTGVQYASDLFVLISYEAENSETAQQLKASIEAGGMAGIAKLEGKAETDLKNMANMSNVRVTIRVAADGFELTPTSSALLAQLVAAETSDPKMNAQRMPQIIDALKQLHAGMIFSLQRDVCRDVGEGECKVECDPKDPNKCTKEAAPGFKQNKRRAAKTVGVALGTYENLPNVEFSGPSPFKQIRERQLLVERFIRDWAELEERIESAYRNEIETFVQATDKAAFQVAPPAAPLRTPDELNGVIRKWSDEFFPDTGTQVGFTYEKAANTLKDCWEGAKVDFSTECATNAMRGNETEAWKGVFAQLEKYGAEGRVLPLQYKVHSAIAARQLTDACADFNTDGVTYRPPTLAEVPLLAPLVGFGAVNWDGDAPHEVWFTHPNPTAQCNPASGFPNPLFKHNPATGRTEFSCGEADGTIFDGTEAVVICVPSNGPLPILEAP